MLLFFSKLFKKPKPKVINNNPTVNVTVVETPKPKKKLSVEEIVDALDGVHSANDDVYTNVALSQSALFHQPNSPPHTSHRLSLPYSCQQHI